jgi:hypothetical protein
MRKYIYKITKCIRHAPRCKLLVAWHVGNNMLYTLSNICQCTFLSPGSNGLQPGGNKPMFRSNKSPPFLCCWLLNAGFLLALLFDSECGSDIFFHGTTRRYMLEDKSFRSHRCENLEYKIMANALLSVCPARFHQNW